MANRLYKLDFTVPANTPKTAPITTPFTLEDAILVSMTIVVPPGHVGLTGIRIVRSQQQVIPFGNLSFLVMDNEKLEIDLNEEIQRKALVASAFNTDIFPHTFYIRAVIADLGSSTSQQQSILPASLSTGVDSTLGSIGLPASGDLATEIAQLQSIASGATDVTVTTPEGT